MNVLYSLKKVKNTVKHLAGRQTTHIGEIIEVDCFGDAEWNDRHWKPAVKVRVILDNGLVDDFPVPCRVSIPGAKDNAGVWLPPAIGMRVPVYFFETLFRPYVTLDGFYVDGYMNPPDEATETNYVVKHGGHTFIIENGEDGSYILLKTENGNKIKIISDESAIIIETDGGNRVVLDDESDTITIKTDEGAIRMTAKKDVIITGKLGVELSSDVKISLKTAGILRGILTEDTHPVCIVTGAPIGGHPDIKAG